MDLEESLLRSWKSLPPPFKDHDVPQNQISPHLGSVSSTQSEMSQGTSISAKETEGGHTQEDGVETMIECKSSNSQKGKIQEAAATVRKNGPLNLLDLPLDILKDIFKEVSTCSSGIYRVLTAL